MQLLDELIARYNQNAGIFTLGSTGYWSNLNKDENKALIEALKSHSAREALLKYQPRWENIIFSPKRQAGLELLEMTGAETCIDYGCMWGALTIPLAKRARFVLGVDQTFNSLQFLKARAQEENLANVALLCTDLKEMPIFENKVDIAIINGVLEWIPEHGEIELKSYYGNFHKKEFNGNPYTQQKLFIEKVYHNLKDGGKVYLAIENRYDFKMFIGVKDPHCNLLFTSFLPRRLASMISRAQVGRPYVNWLYSFQGIRQILMKSGFSKVELFMCFPEYRFPERIIPYNQTLKEYSPCIATRNSKGERSVKRILARAFEYFIFKIMRANFLAPSIVAVGYK